MSLRFQSKVSELLSGDLSVRPSRPGGADGTAKSRRAAGTDGLHKIEVILDYVATAPTVTVIVCSVKSVELVGALNSIHKSTEVPGVTATPSADPPA